MLLMLVRFFLKFFSRHVCCVLCSVLMEKNVIHLYASSVFSYVLLFLFVWCVFV